MDIHPLVSRILTDRGIADYEQQIAFLFPSYTDLSDPFTMQDMQRAVERIFDAVKNNERICIYADYDADGVPGAVVIHEFFKTIKHDKIQVYIPHRHNEGYGIHGDSLTTLKLQGVSLVISVDVGITAHEGAQMAKDLGIDLIVTDHHEPAETLPEVYALVHPKLGTYSDPMICGCAVAFQLVRALHQTLRDTNHERAGDVPLGNEKWLLDLVGLSTIADMVPLQKENRILARFGLLVAQKTRRPGFLALANTARIALGNTNETELAFRIVPRINAASRMETALLAFDLLATDSHVRAEYLSKQLHRLNEDRKKLTDQTVKVAKKQMLEQAEKSIAVIGGDDWHIGIMGIVAGKMVEEYEKPVLVWAKQQSGKIKGSFRTLKHIDLLEPLLGAVGGIEGVHMGGHAQAGGFSIESEAFETFINAVHKIALPEEGSDTVEVNQTPVYQLPLREISVALHTQLRHLAPFGAGNPAPIIRVSGTVVQVKKFGSKNEYTKIYITDITSNEPLEVTSFGKTLDQLRVGNSAIIDGEIEHSKYTKSNISFRATKLVHASMN